MREKGNQGSSEVYSSYQHPPAQETAAADRTHLQQFFLRERNNNKRKLLRVWGRTVSVPRSNCDAGNMRRRQLKRTEHRPVYSVHGSFQWSLSDQTRNHLNTRRQLLRTSGVHGLRRLRLDSEMTNNVGVVLESLTRHRRAGIRLRQVRTAWKPRPKQSHGKKLVCECGEAGQGHRSAGPVQLKLRRPASRQPP